MNDQRQRRIIEARERLRKRFLARQVPAPSMDGSPQGTGPINAHGMPELPVGQFRTEKWPVLDLGIHPDVSTDDWGLVVDGAVEAPLELDWHAFMDLPQVEDVSDFHCVTTWSKLGMRWTGVRVSDVLALAMPLSNASHVMCYAHDKYTTNVALEDVLLDDVLLVHAYEGAPLPREHGGPVRMITPRLYAWKGAKWINRIEVMIGDRLGFWENRGYSNTARPWLNDRYSSNESGSPGAK